MAGGFDPIDPQRCAHYAGFASHLDRRSFDFIYWFLFALVISMLFLSSWKYSGLVFTLQHDPPGRNGQTDLDCCCLVTSIRCGSWAWSPGPGDTETG